MTFTHLIGLLAAATMAATLPAAAQTATGLANPASQNCAAQGGSSSIEKNAAGGEFGVCTFADNLQCEEWALLRGDCRRGGIKVTGFVTAAARYCAITGGSYRVGSGSHTAAEQGRCSFGNGKSCVAADYFAGRCSRDAGIRARFACDAGKSVDALFDNGAQHSVALVLSDGRALSLPQTPSGSGARYANADESIVFWNKGRAAFIEERGKLSYSGCATRP
jgi:putative hemolysin